MCTDDQKGVCVLYSDACAALQTVGVCNFDGSVGLTTKMPSGLFAGYAKSADAQQTSELYGVCLSVAMAALSRRSALILTDSQACCAWFARERLPTTFLQSQLLLATSLLQTLSAVDITVRWTPGQSNPADSWSRASPHQARDENPPDAPVMCC